MKTDLLDSKPRQNAWVVFTGQADLPWLKLLKPGFRHCFVALHDGRHWLTLDPLSPHMEAQIHNLPPEFDLPRLLKAEGLTVIRTKLHHDHRRPAPLMLFTCVEAVKRILGIHNRFILTPWQLYCHLTKGDLSWEV